MTESRRALVVAGDEFQDVGLRALVAPRRDADDFARVLADPDIANFEVQTIINRPRHEVERAIARFFSAGRRDETLILYFSGHGVKDENGLLYFATPDTELDLLSASAVASSFVSGQLDRARAETKVVVLDCCYSGAFSRSLMTKADARVNATEELRGIGRVVMTASNAIQYSFEGSTPEGEATQSVFTQHLVAGLETGAADLDGDGRITADELYRYVHDQVVTHNPRQRPSISVETQGLVVLAKSRAGVRPAALPEELVDALEHPIARVRLGATAELVALLGSKDARLTAAARAGLEAMLDDDSRLVSEAASAALARLPLPQPSDLRAGGLAIEPDPIRYVREADVNVLRDERVVQPEEVPAAVATPPGTPAVPGEEGPASVVLPYPDGENVFSAGAAAPSLPQLQPEAPVVRPAPAVPEPSPAPDPTPPDGEAHDDPVPVTSGIPEPAKRPSPTLLDPPFLRPHQDGPRERASRLGRPPLSLGTLGVIICAIDGLFWFFGLLINGDSARWVPESIVLLGTMAFLALASLAARWRNNVGATAWFSWGTLVASALVTITVFLGLQESSGDDTLLVIPVALPALAGAVMALLYRTDDKPAR